MKAKNSIKNSIWAMLSNVLAILIGLISQAFFLKILDLEYLGINGLFSNIISMLGIVELGIGNAIVYNLYGPLVEKNETKIKGLMNFYKRSYTIIGMVVFIIGMLILPFLNTIVGEVSLNINLELVYILFIIDVCCSYFLSYKRSLLYADQKNYYINIIHIFYLIFMNLFQLVFLFFSKSYYIYLIIKIIFRILENLIITLVVNKKYKYIKVKNFEKLDEQTRDDIFQKIRALFFHKVGTFVVNGTDNIVISKFLGVSSVGLYSNYYLIINSVQTLFCQSMSGVTASIGHLLVENNSEKSFYIFDKIRFINFWIATFSAISIYLIIQPFIILWIGEEYLISKFIILVLVINYFLKMMTMCFSIYKESAGIFKEDQFVPLIESIINILVSVILVNIIGLAGVFIGTIVSSLTYWLYSYPKFIYKGIFKRSYTEYAKDNIKYLILFFIILTISIMLYNLLITNNVILNFIFSILVSVLLPNTIMILIFIKNEKFRFIVDTFKKVWI